MLGHRPTAWAEDIDAAAERFWTCGTVPTDPALLEGVLVLAALQAFLARAQGLDMTDELAAFSTVSATPPVDRDHAVRVLGDLLAARSRARAVG